MQFANFDIISTNYDVRGSALEKKVKTHSVKVLGGVRVGLFGMGVSPKGLITPENFKPVQYLDPVRMARGVVKLLREQEKCTLVLGHVASWLLSEPDGSGRHWRHAGRRAS